MIKFGIIDGGLGVFGGVWLGFFSSLDNVFIIDIYDIRIPFLG